MQESTISDLPVKRQFQLAGSTIAFSGPNVAGVFYLNSSLSAADIRDGLSHTAFASEIRVVDGLDFRGVLHYPEGPLYHHNYTPNSSVPDEIRSGGCVSVPDAPCDGSLFNSWNPRKLTMTARSAHPGGVDLLLGDGGVRFVGDSVALNVWQALCTPCSAPGEVITAIFETEQTG